MHNFTPAYYSIKQDIKDKIAKGVLQPGELLPSRKSMCESYECSWGTLNRSINELILEGRLIAEKGKGTYVASRPPADRLGDSSVKTLNVFVCNPFPSVYVTLSEMMDGIREEANRENLSVRFCDVAGPHQIPGELDEYIVITPSNYQRESLIAAREQGARFIVLNSSWQDVPFPCIDADIFGAVTDATRLLLQNGHRHIGLLGIRTGFSNYERRVDAFREAFVQAGIPQDWDWISGRMENKEEAKRLYDEWLDRHPEITAIFAADYATTMILLELLLEKGISVPDRMSLFTVGTPQLASGRYIAINTIAQPFHEMGRLAVRRLLDRQLTPGTEFLECKLLPGESVAVV